MNSEKPCDPNKYKIRVSSVLNKDTKQFGKQFLCDSKEDTCWSSDQGSPQWINVTFDEAVIARELHIQFQGGFVGQSISIKSMYAGGSASNELFHPKDNNTLQVFILNGNSPVVNMKIIFPSSTDFFGRIIVYHLEII